MPLIRLALALGLLLGAHGARATILHDQSTIDPTTGQFSINSAVHAQDFVLTSQAALTDLRVWLSETSIPIDDGTFQGFSGTLGWGIYADAGGSPGAFVTSGQGAPTITDTLLNNTFSGDIFTADLTLPGPILAPGSYWFALHEGAWLSPGDVTSIGWFITTTPFGVGHFTDLNETAPGTNWQGPFTSELAIVLQGTIVPEPSSLILGAIGLLPLAAYASRRRGAATPSS